MSQKASLRLLQSNRSRSFDRRGSWRFSPAPDVTFLRSWLVYDSSLASSEGRGKFNWSFLTGILVAGGASFAFWAGVSMALSHL